MIFKLITDILTLSLFHVLREENCLDGKWPVLYFENACCYRKLVYILAGLFVSDIATYILNWNRFMYTAQLISSRTLCSLSSWRVSFCSITLCPWTERLRNDPSVVWQPVRGAKTRNLLFCYIYFFLLVLCIVKFFWNCSSSWNRLSSSSECHKRRGK